MNGLPVSTLRTTPHLLHTRSYLSLPMSIHSRGIQDSAGGDIRNSELEAARARERAEKRMQTVTKEADWRIAKAYVAVASLEDQQGQSACPLKSKEGVEMLDKKRQSQGSTVSRSLEAQAIDQYLDDEEWEERERRDGRGLAIPSFPLFESSNQFERLEKRARAWWSSWQR